MINAAIFIKGMFSILGNHFSSRYFRFEIWIQSSVGVTKICYTDKKSLPFSQLFVGVWQRDFLWWGKAHVVGINVRSVVEFQRWWVLKSKIFGQESTYSKDFFLNPLMNYGSSKSAKIILSKSIFNVKNQPNFFKKNFI